MSTQAYAYGGTKPDDVRVKIECRRPAWIAYHMCDEWRDSERDDVWESPFQTRGSPDKIHETSFQQADTHIPSTRTEYLDYLRARPELEGRIKDVEEATEEDFLEAREFIRKAASYGCHGDICY